MKNETVQTLIDAAKNRVSLTSTIDALTQGTFIPQEKLTSENLTRISHTIRTNARKFLHSPYETSRNNRAWDRLKIERNAIISLIIEAVYANMKDDIAMLKQNKEVRDADFKALFSRHLSHWSRNVANYEPTQQDATRDKEYGYMTRLEAIANFGEAIGAWKKIKRSHYSFGEEFIMRGMNTADNALRNFMKVIPIVFEREGIPFTTENFEKSLHASRSFFTLMASMNLAYGPRFLQALERGFKHTYTGTFHDRFFTINKDTLRISIPRKTLERMHGGYRDFFQSILSSPIDGVTTECPAVRYQPEFFNALYEHYRRHFLEVHVPKVQFVKDMLTLTRRQSLASQ